MDQFYRFTPALRIHKRHFTHTKFIFIDCWIHPLPLDFLYKRVNMFSKFFSFSIHPEERVKAMFTHKAKKIPAYSLTLSAILFVLQYLPGVWCEQWIWAEVWDISSETNSHSHKTKHSAVCVKCNSNSTTTWQKSAEKSSLYFWFPGPAGEPPGEPWSVLRFWTLDVSL